MTTRPEPRTCILTGADGENPDVRHTGGRLTMQMFALTTTQGTAMAETALCSEHHLDPSAINTVTGRAVASDWDGGPFRDCTDNTGLACTVCGRRTQRRIEIIHYRDSDSGCDLTVYVDGVKVTDFTEFNVDPGAGYEGLRSEWDETTEDDCRIASPLVAERLRELRDDVAENSKYITEG